MQELKQTDAMIETGNGIYSDVQMIERIINTLCSITVSGRDNLDRLLGCIVALDAVLKGMKERNQQC